jgi:hypothetical protein
MHQSSACSIITDHGQWHTSPTSSVSLRVFDLSGRRFCSGSPVYECRSWPLAVHVPGQIAAPDHFARSVRES